MNEENKELEKTETVTIPQEQEINSSESIQTPTAPVQPQIEVPQNTELVTDPVTLKTETRTVSEKPIENVEVSKPVASNNDDGSKGKRVLLLIFFILVFAFVMGMPYINEYLDKLKKDVGMSDIERRAKQIEEEQKQKEAEKKKTVKQEETKKFTCTSLPHATADYTKVVEETFEYNSKKEIIKNTVKTTYTFLTINDSYNTLKSQCDTNGLKYIDKEGYESACSYSDTEVVIENTFDLEIFKPIQDENSVIQSSVKYLEKVDNVKEGLTSQGYTCE